MSMQTSEMRVYATTAIGHKALADKWLVTASNIFGGSTPLAALSTVEGCFRVMQQLSWFAGKPFGGAVLPARADDTIVDLLSDPMMDIVLRRAGTGPEELLALCREVAAPRRAARAGVHCPRNERHVPGSHQKLGDDAA